MFVHFFPFVWLCLFFFLGLFFVWSGFVFVLEKWRFGFIFCVGVTVTLGGTYVCLGRKCCLFVVFESWFLYFGVLFSLVFDLCVCLLMFVLCVYFVLFFAKAFVLFCILFVVSSVVFIDVAASFVLVGFWRWIIDHNRKKGHHSTTLTVSFLWFVGLLNKEYSFTTWIAMEKNQFF